MSKASASPDHECGTCARPTLLPPRLATGDTVAVCTPSAPGAAIAPARFDRGVAFLRDAGFEVLVGAQAHVGGYTAGPAAERAAEINTAIRDRSVRAIFTSIGGHNTNGVLPYVDFEALRRDPKIIIGYSDITALLMAAYAQAGIAAFHGPTLLPEIAEYPEPLSYTWAALRAAVMTAAPVGALTPPPETTEEFLLWDADDVRPRRMTPAAPWCWLADGAATGRLAGGNLDTICAIIGTPYLSCLTGTVLFWESCADSLAIVERDLCHLDSASVTSSLRGMIVGRSFRAGPGFEAGLRALVRDQFGGRGFPIVAGVDLGHTDPMLTLPIGVDVALDSGSGLVEIIGAAVR